MFRVTRHGWREMLIGTVVLCVLAVVLGHIFWPLAIPLVAVLAWLFAFFRDPERAIPTDDRVMVSPADGVVSDITEIENDLFLGTSAIRVGIFLSVFNVHINRSPCEGRVRTISYKRGKFINAMHHNEASEQNESNTVVLEEPISGRPVAVVKQIVGLIARRIVCTAKPGDSLGRGQRFGMIKFGSRTELTIPTWLAPEIVVKVGQPVRGAADIIARLGNPLNSAVNQPEPNATAPVVPKETPA